jgi:hypothetical protein
MLPRAKAMLVLATSTRPCLHEFSSIVTHERIYSPPTAPNMALEQIGAWLDSPSVVPLSETEGYWEADHRSRPNRAIGTAALLADLRV